MRGEGERGGGGGREGGGGGGEGGGEEERERGRRRERGGGGGEEERERGRRRERGGGGGEREEEEERERGGGFEQCLLWMYYCAFLSPLTASRCIEMVRSSVYVELASELEITKALTYLRHMDIPRVGGGSQRC